MTTANAILTQETLSEMPVRSNSAKLRQAQSSEDQRWDAVVARDAARDGQFVFAVSSTGVYCRPSCAARHPR
ncbi:MAG: Ada metal-binding domain-containing protein, partial [Candidatus Sulfotelmatobacter sp.]